MIVFLIRHGADDSTKRGGWSNGALTEEGLGQSERLAQTLAEHNCAATKIVSSDLPRAKQTAEILTRYLRLPVVFSPDFREVNNGDLAGMDNAVAEKQYPGLYWKSLAWEQRYPNGESPKAFYERVKTAWENLLAANRDSLILVTHGGVINIILHLLNGVPYSNKNAAYKIEAAQCVEIQIKSSTNK